MDFVMSLPLFVNWKGDSYNLVLVIVDRLTKIVHYEPVKVTINTLGLAEVIIDVVVQHHGLPNSIISDRGAISTPKFGLCSDISSASSNGSPCHSTLRQIGRQNDKTAR